MLGQGDDDFDVGEEVEEREEREAGREEDGQRAVDADQRKRHPCKRRSAFIYNICIEIIPDDVGVFQLQLGTKGRKGSHILKIFSPTCILVSG